jgi:signal transduction histidine kinase/CheY-like chemotaxis protein
VDCSVYLTFSCIWLGLGMGTLLRDTKMTPMQEESMKMILASGDLLLAIVNDVLDYAKLETDHVELNIRRSDLQDMLQSILYSIEIKANSRGQSIKATYDPHLPVFVNTDIRRIQQSEFELYYSVNFVSTSHQLLTLSSLPTVMFNLLGNAVKFSKDNGVVELEVSYVRGQSEGSDVALPQKTASKSLEESKERARKGSVQNANFLDTRNSEPQPASRCPFHKPTKNAEKEELSVTQITETRTRCGEQFVEEGLSICRHSGLYHRELCTLRFVVTDYGKGIDKSDYESIFRPFHQATGTEMDEVYGGTGLGLAITKKLVTALGGTISVDSEVGSWSKFTVELPCSDPPAPVEELAKKMSDATIVLAGLPEDQHENVLGIFKAFSIDNRSVDSLEGFASTLLADTQDSIDVNRRVLCLIHGDTLTSEWLKLVSENQKQRKIVVFTFGSHYTKASIETIEHVHHIRSLEQVIPQALVETLHEKSSAVNFKASTRSNTVSTLIRETQIPEDSYRNLRILIAEDNKINQKVLLRMLGRLGVESVDVVENGRDALEKEESTAYDVILMDQQMPVMGGVQACRIIVNRPKRIHPVPFVFFVTAHVSPAFEKECRDAGSTGFLPKPFKFDDIGKCLRNVAKMVADRGC